MAVIEFGDYSPDIPELKNAGVSTATNCVGYPWGYKEMKSLAEFSDGLPAYARGFISAETDADVWYGYAGTESKLHLLATTSWSDAGTGFSLTSEEGWEFLKWETEVYAATISEHVQKDTIGAGSFSALITSTSKPKARRIAQVGQFLVLGNIDEAVEGTHPDRVWWSALNDPTDFDVSVTTQSGFQDLTGGGGAIQKVIGGPHGIILKEREIWLMRYEGPPTLFRFDRLHENRGTIAPGSVIQVGSFIYFLDRDGFYRMPYAGGEPVGIGKDRVDNTITGEMDENSLHRVSVTYDATTSCILWGRPRTSGDPDRIDVYNVVSNRWSVIEQSHELLALDRTRAFNIDTAPMASWNIDTEDFDIDSSIYKGGALRVGAFSSAHRLGYFTGSALTATLETGEVQPMSPGRAYINMVRPLVTGSGTATVQVGTRELQTDSVTWSGAESVNSQGYAENIANARYMRFRVNVTGGFTDAMGVEIEPRPAGEK